MQKIKILMLNKSLNDILLNKSKIIFASFKYFKLRSMLAERQQMKIIFYSMWGEKTMSQDNSERKYRDLKKTMVSIKKIE